MKTIPILTRALTAAALVAATTSCGSVVRSSRAPVLLVIDLLQATRGATTAGTAGSSLVSDVLTIVTSGGGPSPVATTSEVWAYTVEQEAKARS